MIPKVHPRVTGGVWWGDGRGVVTNEIAAIFLFETLQAPDDFWLLLWFCASAWRKRHLLLLESQDESLLILPVAIWREGRGSDIRGVVSTSNHPAHQGVLSAGIEGDRVEQGAEQLSGESRTAKVRTRAGSEKWGGERGLAAAVRESCPTTRTTP